jgi:Tol biopolymer transport system component
MRTFLSIALAVGLFTLNTQGLRSEEQTNATVSIPIGKLAFVKSANFGSAGSIYIMAGSRRTPTLAFKTRELEFLPDGKRIIYCANDSEAQGIYVYDLKQHTNTPLLTNTPGAEAPSWSPDGTKIAFVLYPEGRKSSQVFTAKADGSNVKQLTEGQYYNWTPRWSPDGKQLILETTRNDNPDNHEKNGGHRDIYLMDGEGQNQGNLTSGAYGHHPSWSPDGKRIAYMAAGGVWVMKADGSAKQNISHGTTRDSEPAWSPDGQFIAFTRTANKAPGPETMDIWIMKSDGTEQRQVTFNHSNSASYSPSWSK